MSTNSQILNTSETEPWLRQLLPAGACVHARREPGDAAALTPAEALHVARAVPKRIREFAAGRACARAALAEMGAHRVELLVAADRQPLWPPGFVGSISHTSDLCVAAVASQRSFSSLGLDVEVISAPTPDIWPTICRDEERRWVDSLAMPSQPAAVTLLFAAKEAFYKCQYPLVGEWLDFHDLRVDVDWGPDCGWVSVTATRPIHIADRVKMPLRGRYAFHRGHVAVAFAIAAV